MSLVIIDRYVLISILLLVFVFFSSSLFIFLSFISLWFDKFLQQYDCFISFQLLYVSLICCYQGTDLELYLLILNWQSYKFKHILQDVRFYSSSPYFVFLTYFASSYLSLNSLLYSHVFTIFCFSVFILGYLSSCSSVIILAFFSGPPPFLQIFLFHLDKTV